MTSILSTAISATETEENNTNVDWEKDMSLQKISWGKYKKVNNDLLLIFFYLSWSNGPIYVKEVKQGQGHHEQAKEYIRYGHVYYQDVSSSFK